MVLKRSGPKRLAPLFCCKKPFLQAKIHIFLHFPFLLSIFPNLNINILIFGELLLDLFDFFHFLNATVHKAIHAGPRCMCRGTFRRSQHFFKKSLDFSGVLCYNTFVCRKNVFAPPIVYRKQARGLWQTLLVKKYSSGERADRRLWRMEGGERVAAVKIWRSEQRATNFGHRNRIEEAAPFR